MRKQFGKDRNFFQQIWFLPGDKEQYMLTQFIETARFINILGTQLSRTAVKIKRHKYICQAARPEFLTAKP